MQVEEHKDNNIVSMAVEVEPSEVKAWVESSDTLEGKGFDDASQKALKNAVTARAEYELLNHRVPSPLTRPMIVATEDVVEGEPFKFTMSFAELPQSELNDYSPVELPRRRPEVTEEEIDKLLESTIGSVAATTPKGPDAVVEDGDTIDIALDSVSEGKVYHPLTASKRYYELGSGFMPKAFDDMLRGMKTGESASVDLKVPHSETPYDDIDGYIDVTVTATVNAIMRDSVDSVTDEWVRKQFPGIYSVEDLRKTLASQLLAEKEEMYASSSTGLVLRKLADRLVDGNIPDEIMEMQAREAIDNIRTQVAEQGRTMEDFLEMQSTDEKQLHLSLMIDIRAQDRQMMALDAWARKFNLKADETQIERYQSMVANDVGAEAAEEILGSMYDGALEESVVRMMAQRQAMVYQD